MDLLLFHRMDYSPRYSVKVGSFSFGSPFCIEIHWSDFSDAYIFISSYIVGTFGLLLRSSFKFLVAYIYIYLCVCVCVCLSGIK